MANIKGYSHHGEWMYVDLDLKGLHREHCLCFHCNRFKPNTQDNCDYAEQNFRACKVNGMVMPVYECKHYEYHEFSHIDDLAYIKEKYGV